ncbi:diacylglycerol kinase family protein [Fervidibacillus halotolerans]|uniref:Diacylglycerol kinase family protein n=1 Tax=Fervidibacillus halotolerans TaxID=2980027 RepID=A0A9E8RXT5_9BACI|nr:diacylglycerol kinase family protein [Fervidibacillus halotolerans]WAA11493.1 diacylglycerol kinase family protein [Fervidibacillus halotolerans]
MKKLIHSFRFAINGFYLAFKREQNLKIHILATFIVVFFGFYFRISSIEWTILILTIGGMISAELMNTAIERTVDLVEEKFHPVAKQAKDIAASACLVYAIASVLIGCIIFLPKIVL